MFQPCHCSLSMSPLCTSPPPPQAPPCLRWPRTRPLSESISRGEFRDPAVCREYNNACYFYRRKQKNPKSLARGPDSREPGSLDRSFDGSNGGSLSGDDTKDISELVKVEINNSSDDVDHDNSETTHLSPNRRWELSITKVIRVQKK